MIKNKLLVLILVLSLVNIGFSWLDATLMETYPALSLANPAYSGRVWEWQLDFYKPYAGIGDQMYNGGFSTRYGFSKWNLSLDMDFFSSDMYYKTYISPGFGMRLGNLSIGLAPKILLDGWNTDNFNYTDGETDIDPYFNNNENTNAVSFVVGAALSTNIGTFGILGEDLLPASMSSEETDRNAVEPKISVASRHPLAGGYVNFGLGYDISAPSGKEFMSAIGYSRLIYKTFGFTSSYDINRNLLDAGLSFNILKNYAISYAFEYPLTDVGQVSKSHRVAISGSMLPKAPTPNLTIRIVPSTNKSKKGESVPVDVIVENNNGEIGEMVNVHCIANSDTILDQLIRIGKNESQTLNTLVKIKGRTKLFAIVDTDNMIKETSETDNYANASIDSVLTPLIANISVTPNELRIKEVKHYYQDRSVVPIIFFDKNSSKINSRFNDLIKLLAERISNNPDVEIELTGFLSPDENNEQIAQERAKNIKAAITKINNSIEPRIRIVDAENPNTPRVPEKSSREGDTERLLEENRRVEIKAIMKDAKYTHQPYDMTPNLLWSDFENILKNNNDVVMIINTDNKKGDTELAMSEATRLRKYAIGKMSDYLKDRVYASVSRMPRDKNESYIYLSPDGILYKPHVIGGSSEMSPKRLPEGVITLNVEGAVKNWYVDAFNAATHEFSDRIFEGTGKPAKTLKWDFIGKDGQILPLQDDIMLRFVVSDSMGQVETTFTKETIETIVEEHEIRDERMLMVQFEFDKPAAQSRYLEDRLETVARKIVGLILENNKTEIIIEGNTDIIGSDKHNNALSVNRATRMEDLLKITMSQEANIPQSKFELWLKQHNATIKSIGNGATKPFHISKMSNNSKKEVLIGDNNLPEGRMINRSVIVRVKTEK